MTCEALTLLPAFCDVLICPVRNLLPWAAPAPRWRRVLCFRNSSWPAQQSRHGPGGEKGGDTDKGHLCSSEDVWFGCWAHCRRLASRLGCLLGPSSGSCLSQVIVNWKLADLSDRDLAMLEFALAVCRADDITEEHFQKLEKHGFDREDAWDIGMISAFFAMSNRIAHFVGLRPNPEFYSMGRTPRGERGKEEGERG